MLPIAIILAEGFEEVEAVTPIDLVRRAGIPVHVVGLTNTTVEGSHGIKLTADMLLNRLNAEIGGIILPGGPGYKRLLESVDLLELVKTTFSRNLLCAAICAAPAVFGKAGILAGKKAACFPGTEPQLTGATIVNDPVVIDGALITSRGAGTAVPFSLAIIEFLKGAQAADEVASKIIYR